MLEDTGLNYGLLQLAPQEREPKTEKGFCPVKIQGCPHENPECAEGKCYLNFIVVK
jgi:hypothetical protein